MSARQGKQNAALREKELYGHPGASEAEVCVDYRTSGQTDFLD